MKGMFHPHANMFPCNILDKQGNICVISDIILCAVSFCEKNDRPSGNEDI